MAFFSKLRGAVGLDARLFLGIVLSGAILMFVMKVVGAPQLIITSIMILLIIAYTAVVLLYPRLYLRHDQAGDNAYYIGLIFTLLSMTFALYSIGQTLASEKQDGFSEAEMLIGDFGLALGTTLIGIICRLVLHQMRIDPADVEEQTRIQLATAADDMRLQIKDLSIQLGNFFAELSQRHNDYVSEVSQKQVKSLDKITKINEESAEGIATRIKSISSDMEEFQMDLRNGTQRLSEVLSEAAGKLERESSGAAESLQSLSGLSEATGYAREQVLSLSTTLSETVPSLKEVALNVSGLAEAMARVREEGSKASNDVKEKVVQVDSELKAMITSIEVQVKGLAGTTKQLSDVSLRSNAAVLQSEEGALQVLKGLADALRNANTRNV